MSRRSTRTGRAVCAVALTGTLALTLALTGCMPSAPRSTPAPTTPASAAPTPAPGLTGPVEPGGAVGVLAEGLAAPWSVVRLTDDQLPGASALISERDTGVVKELTAGGTLRDAGTVPGVASGGEGGLLGLAVLRQGTDVWLYCYLTAASDNRIVRMPLVGTAGALSLGQAEDVLTGIPRAGNHNGGRLAFGPDGMLYATTGDAGRGTAAQDLDSLAGKILRMTPDGSAPGDNPFPGSLVYTLGHRNPQGVAWAEDGTLYASEFGQNTWDELNIITPGGNYGWPVAEGITNAERYLDPIQQWATADASPSGLAAVTDTLFMAALRGERLWAIWVGPPSVDVSPYFTGEYGRLRDVVAGPGDTLWVLTNNTDGRGNPQSGDDKLLQIPLQRR
ncbi:PQQ-dependent sugar dehydrogenase [Salinibacterium hongtaonis]|uniref:PQQ-dependent sugar dehydrogenase n=1 Tax=Homoserinimonas hongtaonis TaxID=2079791 RepID=UPI000D3733DC|nr:PQQ-dependent sugar dehydrogenase [Salinibacterium hongtaonis]AWB90027.1 glucose dehydrogenase [Salinibacterium hongtaonis]